MSDYYRKLAARLQERLGSKVASCQLSIGELTAVVPRENLVEVCRVLRDDAELAFEQLIDVAGVDYLEYRDWDGPRFAVVYHLLSVTKNHRMRIRVLLDEEVPLVDSVIPIWNSANWFEREAFDLFGIMFEGHPDLRRILTDYGFVGHPFRKDFPLTGNVEMRYDLEKKRVVYQPVTIENRVLVPRVYRDDHRYVERLGEREAS